MSVQNGDGSWRCPTCGATFDASIENCPYCAPQKEPEPVQPQPQPAAEQAPLTEAGTETVFPAAAPAPPVPVKKKKWVAPVIVVLIIVIAFFALAFEGVIVIDGITKDYSYGDGAYTYEWKYEGVSYSLSFDIPVSDLYYYGNLTEVRAFTTDGSNVVYDHVKVFVTSEDSVILEVMAGLKQLAHKAGLDTLGTLSLMLAFVQSIPYELDDVQFNIEDYWQYPVETLHNDAGDCEDTAFLYASLVEAYGTDAALIVYDDHVAVGVDCDDATGYYFDPTGVKYYYCETTSEGWEIGAMPDDRIDVEAYVIDVT